VGGAGALAVSWWAHRRSLLSTSGAWAAGAVGTAMFASGILSTVILLLFFFSSALLSKITRASRATGSLVDEQSAPRNACQVFAVGFFPAAAAIGFWVTGNPRWLWGAASAIGFATADTWATDWGQTYPGRPRLLGFGRELPPGLSGGVTLRGTWAGGAGAALMAGVGAVGLQGGPAHWLGLTAVGLCGSLLDSVLGAFLQERRSCDVCGKVTERRSHCGGRTTTNRRGLSNEGVNLVCSAICLWLGWMVAP
jgi:uncharacterized protein (TIGR00297 family)